MLQLSSEMYAENMDMRPSELECEDDAIDSLQFFVSSAAANTPLVAPLLTSTAGQHGKLTPGAGLETTDGFHSSCDVVIDFTGLVSPSKVSIVLLICFNL